jgi:hypothetical protein
MYNHTYCSRRLFVDFGQQSFVGVSYIELRVERKEGEGVLVISKERILFIPNLYRTSTILYIRHP